VNKQGDNQVVQYSILVADGDPNAAHYFSGSLRANGFNTASTTSGIEALGLYKSGSPDLVVTDLVLTEMDGMSLLEELKKYDPSARVVITTDNADKNMITRAFRMGVLDVLEKPLDPEFLISKIRDLLAREDRALEGNLQMMSLASIIQINCDERNQAQLTLNYLGKGGTIFFNNGEMVHAETGDLVGDEAIYSLLGWEEGTFKVKMGLEPGLITIDKNWSGLLLEGMRRIDESIADWSPDWEDVSTPVEEEQGNQLPERIVKAIITNPDITSAVICSNTGTLIAQEKSTDPESDIALGALLIEKAENIGGYLDGGSLVRIVLTGSENRFYFQQQKDNYLLLSLTRRSSAETVFKSVQNIYQRYRSA
jgi:CheY-like chemotaxis protein/predicted regulator of Ras-like GTPase activity (Roadblock/LC7/MglB family)